MERTCEAASRSGSGPGTSWAWPSSTTGALSWSRQPCTPCISRCQKPFFTATRGKPFGAEATRQFLLEKGFQLSMSRAGPPTDNGSAERFVGTFKLAVAERCRSETLGEFLRAAQQWVNFYNTLRPHESLEYLSPEQYAKEHGLPDVPPITLL